MGRKNRNKNKKKKESDGSTGNVNGGSSSNNSNNNDIITIPTVATTKTGIVLTTEQLDLIDNTYQLAGYPKSNDFIIGFPLFESEQDDKAIDAFKRGAENDGCVPCMFFYVFIQWRQRGNLHLVLPWALECSMRGHTASMAFFTHQCDGKSKPITAPALLSFWTKTTIELGDTTITEEMRKKYKKLVADVCYVCKQYDSSDKTFEKCGICKYYSYCGKNCHMGECRHLQILHTSCKPRHVKEIREAIINGVDSKDIPRLQNLRTALGLNRPKEEYEDLVLRLGDSDASTIQDRYNYLTARKDGTVHIGSTPNVI